jgi:hypothetical protein
MTIVILSDHEVFGSYVWNANESKLLGGGYAENRKIAPGSEAASEYSILLKAG